MTALETKYQPVLKIPFLCQNPALRWTKYPRRTSLKTHLNRTVSQEHYFHSSCPTIIHSFRFQLTKMSVSYPFKFSTPDQPTSDGGNTTSPTIQLQNVRGRIPSAQTCRLRSMMLEAHNDPNKIIAHACSYDGLSSRLVEEAGFPIVFLAGYAVSSGFGLPDTGYIAMEDMCRKIQEAVRVTSVPVMADGDTGYGSPMNVNWTVESFANAGAAGVMIEDQTWPKSKSSFSPFVNRESSPFSIWAFLIECRMRSYERQIRSLPR